MCLSPDEMSDDQIREIVTYYTEQHAKALTGGHVSNIRYFAAKVADFSGILEERGVPLIPESAPVSVEQLIEIVGPMEMEQELVSA